MNIRTEPSRFNHIASLNSWYLRLFSSLFYVGLSLARVKSSLQDIPRRDGAKQG